VIILSVNREGGVNAFPRYEPLSMLLQRLLRLFALLTIKVVPPMGRTAGDGELSLG
jgi:hypothetical protein